MSVLKRPSSFRASHMPHSLCYIDGSHYVHVCFFNIINRVAKMKSLCFLQNLCITNIISQDFLSQSVVIISILLILSWTLPPTLYLAVWECKWKALLQLTPEKGRGIAVIPHWESSRTRNSLGCETASRNEGRDQDTIVVGQHCGWCSHNSGIVSSETNVHRSLC